MDLLPFAPRPGCGSAVKLPYRARSVSTVPPGVVQPALGGALLGAAGRGCSLRDRRGRTRQSQPLFVPAQVDDEPTTSWSSIEVKDLGEKGFGIVAVAPLSCGEVVLREKPLLALPPSFDGDLDLLLNQTSLSQLDGDLKKALKKLSEEAQQRFWQLADSHSPGPKTAAGVALTNALHLGTGGGLLTRSARFNHSCLPNVQGTWADGCAEWRALRAIAPGEELCFSYVDPYQTDEQRQATLELLFKFKCRCPVCSLEKDAKAASNQNRLQLRDLNEGLQMAAIAADDTEEVLEVLVPEMLELLDSELAGSPALKSKVLHLGFLLSLESENEDLAKRMATQAWENAVLAYGSDSDRAKMLKACAEGDYQSEDFEDMLLEMQSDDLVGLLGRS
ncbi:unnamed protein product [Cladocopium goreaui]|uniref:SET domain-containing protein 5 n=1 Tax=Cladocopium goreaui TaxID=2562237 RepID=A0A9P1CV20_9DINO|nr:unnamed protein product [Cladocopium goreaui]